MWYNICTRMGRGTPSDLREGDLGKGKMAIKKTISVVSIKGCFLRLLPFAGSATPLSGGIRKKRPFLLRWG